MQFDIWMEDFRCRMKESGILGEPQLAADDADKRIKRIRLDESVSLLAQGEDELTSVSVIARATQVDSARGVLAFALAIDALELGNKQWRNGILQRMHLTDGKFRGVATQTNARGWKFELVPKSPARDLMTFTASKT